MKKKVLIAISILLTGLTTVLIACNFHKPTIYKAWNFSNIHAVDASKVSPMDNFAYNFLNKSLQNIKFQFTADKNIKIFDSSGKVLSTGKFVTPDDNSVKFSFGNDSATLYKINALSDTVLNLVDEKQGMVMHLISK